MLAILIWERSAQICFIVLLIVTFDMVSFGVEFQSDTVNDGRVSEGWICTTLVPVKCSRAVVTSILLQHAYSAVLAAQLTTVSLDEFVHKKEWVHTFSLKQVACPPISRKFMASMIHVHPLWASFSVLIKTRIAWKLSLQWSILPVWKFRRLIHENVHSKIQ